jgi:molybdenum cofactor cytidylyltransferase
VRTSAVILAAGAGTRMGGVAKALLVGTDGRTFLRHIFDTLREVGVERPVVVVGQPFAADVRSTADALGAVVVVNPAPERGMASSVATGFTALRNVEGDPVNAAWLWPVDHPYVQVATLQRLLSALMHHDAARPVHGGRGGHPPLVSQSLFARLAACTDAPGGARNVLADADTVDVVVDDPGCVRDVDTRADLEAT